MGMIKEFKDFAFKGNMMDMAIGLIIGGAFGTVVKSLVSDILMPVVGKLTGGMDFSGLFIQLAETDTEYKTIAAAKEAGVATLNYGLFINGLIAFLITAFALFMVIKSINKAKASMEEEKEAEPEKPAEPSAEETLLSEIRDLLKEKA